MVWAPLPLSTDLLLSPEGRVGGVYRSPPGPPRCDIDSGQQSSKAGLTLAREGTGSPW